MPDWIPTLPRRRSRRASGRAQKRTIDAPLVNDELALLWMVNMGCIDMNTWYSRVDRPDRPDFVLFDLDPSPDVPASRDGRRSRCSSRRLLDALGLESFPKTSGARRASTCSSRSSGATTYDETREFAEIVAGALARDAPRARDDGVVEGEAARRADRREPERRGQDDRVGLLGAAAGRARRSRRRSRWDEVGEGLDPRAFTMDAVLDRDRARTATCSRACCTRASASARRSSGSADERLPGGREHPAQQPRVPRPCRASRSGCRTSGSARTTGSRARTGSRRAAAPCPRPSPRTPRSRAR